MSWPALADVPLVRAHLLGAARARTALTYAELINALGYPFSRPKVRQLRATLTAIDEAAAAAGEPGLAVLVVRQSDGVPGQGWWTGNARRLNYGGPWEGPEAAAMIAREQARVFDHWAAR